MAARYEKQEPTIFTDRLALEYKKRSEQQMVTSEGPLKNFSEDYN